MPAGTVVVARTMPFALLIWDASPVVGDLVVARRSGADATRELECDAIAILGSRALRSRAARIELRVQYTATGVAGAPYQASTFADATPLMTLAAARPSAAHQYTRWIADVAAGRTPRGLHVIITGNLPKPE